MFRPMLNATLAITSLPLALSAQSNSSHLNTILQQMNQASTQFRSARAQMNCQYYERVIRDTTSQTGAIYFLRKDKAIQMGVVIDGPDGKPQKVVEYKDGLLELFDPGVNQLTLLHAGSNQAQEERYITLGFGGSGTDLAKSWNIQDLGPETLPQGAKQIRTEKLDLTSKDPGEKNFTHITIWVDPTRALSLRQIFYLSNDDRRTCNYADIRYNGHIDMKTFEIKKNSHTSIVNH
ncbi:MAG: LolA family protein [Acidobacteriaceae bacterium]